MKKTFTLLVAAILIFSLTSCGIDKPQYSENSTVNNQSNTKTSTSGTNKFIKDDSGFASDNVNKNAENKYNSGIYAKDDNLAKPYEIEYTEPDSADTDKQIVKKNSNKKDKVSTKNNEKTEFNKNDTEEVKNTDEKQEDTKDNEKEAEKKLNEAIDDVRDVVINNIYNSGIVLLMNAESVEDYNSKHIIKMDSTVLNLRYNLGNIEYCDKKIKKYMSDDRDVVSSWKELKSKLEDFRNEMAPIYTGEDWLNAGIDNDIDMETEIINFDRALTNIR